MHRRSPRRALAREWRIASSESRVATSEAVGPPSCPAKRGRGTARRAVEGGAGGDACSVGQSVQTAACPSTALSRGPPPPRCARGRINKIASRRSNAPELCQPRTPSSPACGGGTGRGHARLSALTLAAHATGYHPDGSAPEPGFPKTDFASVLPAWPCCHRLSTLRADRSFCRSTGDPEPPRGADWRAYPRAGTAPQASVFQACPSGKAPSMKSDVMGYVTEMGTAVKGW